MNRGDVIIVPGGPDYGKVRPAVVVQTDMITKVWNSIIVCPLSSYLTDVETFARITLQPTAANGLKTVSQIMVDKNTTYPLDRVRVPVGKIEDRALEALNVSLVLMLGLWSVAPK